MAPNSQRQITPCFYTAKRHGGLGLTSLEDTLHTNQITRFLNCISSRDKALQDIAWSQLAAMVRTRRGIKDISTADIENFLNQPPQPQEKSRRDVRSLWSSVRNSLSHMSCPVKLDGSDVSLVKSEISLEARQRETVKKSLMEA